MLVNGYSAAQKVKLRSELNVFPLRSFITPGRNVAGQSLARGELSWIAALAFEISHLVSSPCLNTSIPGVDSCEESCVVKYNRYRSPFTHSTVNA